MTLVVRRPPVPTLDRDGRTVLHIPLANSQLVACVRPEDYDRLLDQGWSGNWSFNCGHVKVSDWRRGPKRVARLIFGPEGDQRIRHRDRDPLNLRRGNLEGVPFVRRKASPRAVF